MIRHLAMLAAASLGCLLGACRSAPETAQLQDRLLARVDRFDGDVGSHEHGGSDRFSDAFDARGLIHDRTHHSV